MLFTNKNSSISSFSRNMQAIYFYGLIEGAMTLSTSLNSHDEVTVLPCFKILGSKQSVFHHVTTVFGNSIHQIEESS